MYLCMILIASSAVVFDTTFAVENFDHLSVAFRMYASLFSSTGRGPAKSNWTSSLGCTTGYIWKDCLVPNIGFKILTFSVQ